ncbi:MAG: ABC transporter permease [Christensenellaceae bacterium]|nr:ABC transporter permease [Christensenellaceae bacterium]PWM63387.1 MAG: hypothetical protein DBX63_00625 [Clostridia bacterium]
MKTLRACWYEFKLAILRTVRYKISFVSDIVVFCVIFFVILFTNAGYSLSLAYNSSESQAKVILLIGYVFWLFSSTALGDSTNVISNEATAGTLETKLLSSVPVPALLFARLLSGLLYSVVSMACVLIIAGIFGWLKSVEPIRLACALLIYLPSIFGMFGIGLILGGLSLNHKRVGQLTFIIQTGMLLLTDVISANFPISNYIVPYATGMDIARNFYMHSAIEPVRIVLYFAINAVWFVIGYTAFSKLLSATKRRGSLANY